MMKNTSGVQVTLLFLSLLPVHGLEFWAKRFHCFLHSDEQVEGTSLLNSAGVKPEAIAAVASQTQVEYNRGHMVSFPLRISSLVRCLYFGRELILSMVNVQ
jgi:hypothetical protein